MRCQLSSNKYLQQTSKAQTEKDINYSKQNKNYVNGIYVNLDILTLCLYRLAQTLCKTNYEQKWSPFSNV